jgi:hypothetical protein
MQGIRIFMVQNKRKYTRKNQVNGALPMESPASIAEMLGERAFPYRELTLDDYRKNLDSMSLSELQKHAIEIAQILPNVSNRSIMVDKLERAYLQKQALLSPKIPKNAILNEAQKEEMNKLLNR